MKAITLHQPWASLIALGAKRVETRKRWHYKHRGPVLIHAGQAIDVDAKTHLWHVATDLGRADVALGLANVLPLGAVVAVADLVSVQRMTDLHLLQVEKLERACGDWQVGRFAIHLENVRPLPVPFVAKGAQGVFEIPVTLRELGL